MTVLCSAEQKRRVAPAIEAQGGEMRMQRHIRVIALGVMLAMHGFVVGRSQASGRPDDVVWQVVTSGSQLRSVYVTEDGRRGWAVGANGTILATEDGGGH